MNAHSPIAGRTLVPTLRYRDVPAAIGWLCRAFGFEKHLVVTGDDGSIRYAQLTFGEGMIMVVPVEDTAFDQLMKQPEEAGGAETQICYLYVADVGAHYTRAKAGGAEILLDLDQGDSSGRGYSCRDLEGHIWNFGTYDPWRRPQGHDRHLGVDGAHALAPRPLRNYGVIAALFLLTVVLGAAIGFSYGPAQQDALEAVSAPASASAPMLALSPSPEVEALIERERSAREAAERAAAAAREQLARERSAREQAERASKEAEMRAERASREAEMKAERASKEAETRAARLAREQPAAAPRATLDAAERASTEARERAEQARREAQAARELLAQEQKAREAAEERMREAREQAARERTAREAAERASKAVRERERARRLRQREAANSYDWPYRNW
jgi:uncharacterized glyoxalase superfamily protein PhnB